MLLDSESSNVVLKDEALLIEQGDYEFPNVDDYVSSDNNYLKDTFRINKLVKSFGNVRAVDNLSLSVYQN